MTFSKNSRKRKSTLRKKNKVKNRTNNRKKNKTNNRKLNRKKNRTKNRTKNRSKNRSKNRTKNKNRNKNRTKNRKINLQIGGNVESIMGRVLHTLERDNIEYLPSTKVIDNLYSEGHYIEMVDYLKLQEIINNNENFKKSPKIRKLFDYDLYEINDKDMYFVYKDFKCENIFKDVDKYYIYILYFYLMECNITRNDKIQQEGGRSQIEDNRFSDISTLSEPSMKNKKASSLRRPPPPIHVAPLEVHSSSCRAFSFSVV